MTCAECQQLLLDLAYGELDAAHAAQVEAHARDCARCGPELAQLQATRRLVAPLAREEESPSRIDAQVMQAARAQALLLGGGTRGPVIAAAAARVEQPTLAGARVDVRARVRARPLDTRDRRRSWMVRAAVAGSVVAAAGLALLVSGKAERSAPRTDEAAYQIQIRTPEVAQAEARRAAAEPAGAKAKTAPARSESALAAKQDEAAPVSAPPPAGFAGAPPPTESAAPAPAASDANDRLADRRSAPPPALAAPPPAQDRSKESRKAAVPRENRDDDASGAELDLAPAAPPPPAAPGSGLAGAASATRGAEGGHASAPLGLLGRSNAAGSAPTAAPGPAASRVAAPAKAPAEQPRAATAAPPAPVAVASAPAAAAAEPEESAAARPAQEKKAEAGKGAAETGAPDAAALERRAEAARRAGGYASAAGLYRSAARLRRDRGDDAAAWDLAHAVECWAAAGRFAEAQADRDELSRSFPAAAGPSGAADRALRAAPADAASH